ncbi:MAG TPA: hypothetical protein DCY13_09715 [Verrucomicrobiales bacterium]|nr:hypothetical protein [Verrucomicrobiales bacterium]
MTDQAPASPSRVLIVVSANPRTSGRLAEAIRIAAGVSAWQKVAVTLYVGGDALQGLLPGDGLFVDEDNIVDFLPTLCERRQGVYLEQGHPLVESNRDRLSFPEIDAGGLARLAAGHDYVMRF